MNAGFRLRLAVPLAMLISLGSVPLAQAAVPAVPVPVQAALPREGDFTSLCGAKDSTHPARLSHVMFIMFENKSYGSIVGSKSAPYMNDTLIPSCGVASNYHNYSHPSTSNYLALTSGMAEGKAARADCDPAGCPQSQDSIFAQLGEAGQSWREYAEAMPGNCTKKNFDNTTYANADGSIGEFYYVRHAPPAYYTSSPVPSECSSQDVPLGTSSAGNLLDALSPGSDGLPSFSFVTPGGCDDMHDCSTKVGDDWLKEWIPVIQQSAAYQSGQLVVFITWDEGAGADETDGETCYDTAHADSAAFPSCHVAAIVMSPHTTPGTVSDDYFNHLSTLGTAEDLLGLPRLPPAQGYTGLQSAFGL